VIRWLDLGTAAALTRKAVIVGGMLPKLQACRDASASREVKTALRILARGRSGSALPEFFTFRK